MSDNLNEAVARLETKQEETEKQLDQLCLTQTKILDKLNEVDKSLLQVQISVTNYNKWLWIVAGVLTTSVLAAVLKALNII